MINQENNEDKETAKGRCAVTAIAVVVVVVVMVVVVVAVVVEVVVAVEAVVVVVLGWTELARRPGRHPKYGFQSRLSMRASKDGCPEIGRASCRERV